MSINNIEKYRNRFGAEIREKEDKELKHMTMLAYFNIGVEHEHLGLNELAVKFYETAFREAKDLNNWAVKNQIIAALKKLKAKRWEIYLFDLEYVIIYLSFALH